MRVRTSVEFKLDNHIKYAEYKTELQIGKLMSVEYKSGVQLVVTED